MAPTIYCKNFNDNWIQYQNPVTIITTDSLSDIIALFKEIESHIEKNKLHAVGFISYNASPAFDSALTTQKNTDFPLLWFGLYEHAESLQIPKNPNIKLNLDATINRTDYLKNIEKIKNYIKAGDTYQVNYTYPMKMIFSEDPKNLFWSLATAQPTPYSMYIETDDWAISSVSPELFFKLNGDKIETRPMKGTRPRALTLKEDLLEKEALFYSEKDRAENLMIVDMIRNDLGRVAKINTVEVNQLFRIEKYPTVWQMTSNISAKTHATNTQILQALFPCASITGAPKPRTMEIIKELEPHPRKVYTGCMGRMLPNRQTQFNVAIRTAIWDKHSKELAYHVGGGIVFDSDPEDEYRESIIKSRITHTINHDFQIIESLLWEPNDGFFILPYHVERMKNSAQYFDFIFSEANLTKHFDTFDPEDTQSSYKIRILLSKNGKITFEAIPIESANKNQRKTVTLAQSPIKKDNVFLYHKTTERDVYKFHIDHAEFADDVLLWNENGEITESSSSNIVFEKNNRKFTPPVKCGLLDGTFRRMLLDHKKMEERIIHKEDIFNYDHIYLINSVRKWQEVKPIK